jgi:hypothetical protein
MTTLDAMRDRKHETRQRVLDIKAELAEHKRVFLTTRENPPPGLRATLEAELTKLEAENYRLAQAIEKIHVANGGAQKRAVLFGRILADKLDELGMHDVVEAAAMASREAPR